MLQGIPQLHLPDVCTESPIRGRAFCSSHCKFIEENYAHVPTGLKEFLKYCGIIPESKPFRVHKLQSFVSTCTASECFQESEVAKADEVINVLPSTGILAASSQGNSIGN